MSDKKRVWPEGAKECEKCGEHAVVRLENGDDLCLNCNNVGFVVGPLTPIRKPTKK